MRALGQTVEVVTDPEPDGPISPLRCARAAWNATPPLADWRLVLQDDALPCRDFLQGAARALSVAPAPVVAFYLGWVPPQTARAALVASEYSTWVPGVRGDWVPTVATAINADVARGVAAFSEHSELGDDTLLGVYCNDRDVAWCATIPSLVQHDDDEPSIIGGHLYHPGARQASCFIGAYSALDVDWTRGL